MSESHEEESRGEKLSPEDQKIKDGLIDYLQTLGEEVKLTPEQKEQIRTIPQRHPLKSPPSQSARERVENKKEMNTERDR
jgi:hypothetical protein